MYCKFCGSQIDDAARFCSKCGKSTNGNSNAVEETQPIQKDKKKQAPFFVCLLVSIFLGVIIGVLSAIIGRESGMLMFASIATGIVFAMALLPFFANSHIRGILAFLVFILGWFIYYVAFIEINEISTGSTIQDIRFYFYMCSPYVMLVLIWTELSRDNIGIGRIMKIVAIWFVLLLVMFLGEIKEKNEDTQVSTEKTDIIAATSTTETDDTNTGVKTLEESILSVYTAIIGLYGYWKGTGV